MAKDLKYIRKRKRTYGYSFLVDIPFESETGEKKHFTKTVRIDEYGSESAALLAAQRFRNNALADIRTGKLKIQFPIVQSLYERKFVLMPLAVSTRDKQDSIFLSASGELLGKRIDKVTTADIQTSVNMYAESHSDDSVHRLVSVWRQIYKVCQILEYPVEDRTAAIVIPKSKKVSERKDVSLSDGELQKVLDGILLYNNRGKESYESRCIWFMLMIMYFTGCRPAEALALRRSDIHENYIDIKRQIGSTSKERQKEVPTKTTESARRVPIADDLRPILDSLVKWSKNDLLLATENGKPQNISRISDVINTVSKKAGVSFFSYKLRHQMSTDLMHRGDSVVARDLLGHTSFAMTLDYARSTDDQLFEAIKDRKLAEFQPKTKNLLPPSMDLNKMYAVMRFRAVLNVVLFKKAVFSG